MPAPSVFGKFQSAKRYNLLSICFNLWLPWFLFIALFAVMSFRIHYDSSSFAWMLVMVGCGIPVLASLLALRALQTNRDHMWYAYAAAACFVSVGVAVFFGGLNFKYNMRPFYQIQTLNMYPDVSPAREKGFQLMDAGRVYFAQGTGIDMTRAMGFRNNELYCVAPITIGNGKLASYDFWAVGVNCCSGVSSDFRCGDYNKPNARAGLRLMRDDQRPFYRLAVQQAEAAYGIHSTHPLFFHWMEDPIDEVNTYQESGFQYFILGTFAYLIFTCFSVISVIFITANSLASVGG